MAADYFRGKTIRWTFTDGPMAGRTFEHVFHKEDGSLTFRVLGGKPDAAPTRVEKYESATDGADVYSVSYLGPSGYTLTVVLDYRTGNLVGFASNEKELALQHGTFEEVGRARVAPHRAQGAHHPQGAR